VRQALAQEVAGFGIHVTIIEPGGFSTDWGGASARLAEPDPAYDEVREAGRRQRAARTSKSGDPQSSALAVLEIVDAEQPPLRVFFGERPLEVARADYASRLANWEKWQHVAELAQG
jgi:NAD(P)-dependent dehydrogenase (short-subunit alcohol dehydrogenase family)